MKLLSKLWFVIRWGTRQNRRFWKLDKTAKFEIEKKRRVRKRDKIADFKVGQDRRFREREKNFHQNCFSDKNVGLIIDKKLLLCQIPIETEIPLTKSNCLQFFRLTNFRKCQQQKFI